MTQELDPPGWHAGDPSTPPDIADAIVKLMMGWFLNNFEDPVHRTPHDEGEYVFIWGGPYDAQEELEGAFGHIAPPELIEAAVAQVEHVSTLWAPSVNRMQPDAP